MLENDVQDRFTQDGMLNFESLPLELRSEILKDWLEDTLTRCRVGVSPLSWEDRMFAYGRWQYLRALAAESQRAGPSWFQALSKTTLARRNEAATKIRTLIRAFPAEDQLDLKRLIGVHLVRYKENGRMVCAQLEVLRAAYQRGSGRVGVKEWVECTRKIRMMEWSCNVIEMVVGHERNDLTDFTTEFKCAWGGMHPYSQCECHRTR